MAKRHARRGMGGDIALHVDGKEFVLSPQERRIILLILAGYSNMDVARQFSLNVSTISRRTSRILGKLGVANKLELVLFALHHGIARRLQEKSA